MNCHCGYSVSCRAIQSRSKGLRRVQPCVGWHFGNVHCCSPPYQDNPNWHLSNHSCWLNYAHTSGKERSVNHTQKCLFYLDLSVLTLPVFLTLWHVVLEGTATSPNKHHFHSQPTSEICLCCYRSAVPKLTTIRVMARVLTSPPTSKLFLPFYLLPTTVLSFVLKHLSVLWSSLIQPLITSTRVALPFATFCLSLSIHHAFATLHFSLPSQGLRHPTPYIPPLGPYHPSHRFSNVCVFYSFLSSPYFSICSLASRYLVAAVLLCLSCLHLLFYFQLDVCSGDFF